MNSLDAKLFLAIQARILEKVTAIRWIDQDFGQLEHYEIKPSVLLPCSLIDINNFEFSDRGDQTQVGEGDVVIRVAFPPYSSTSQITPQQWKEKALDFYELEWLINKALHCWSPGDEYGYLTRKSVKTERRNDNFRVRVMRYRVNYDDNSTRDNISTARVISDYSDEYDVSDYPKALFPVVFNTSPY